MVPQGDNIATPSGSTLPVVVNNNKQATHFLTTSVRVPQGHVEICFLGSQGVPFVVAGHNNYDHLDMLIKLDKICSSCLSNHVAKRASTRQVCVFVCVRVCQIFCLIIFIKIH